MLSLNCGKLIVDCKNVSRNFPFIYYFSFGKQITIKTDNSISFINKNFQVIAQVQNQENNTNPRFDNRSMNFDRSQNQNQTLNQNFNANENVENMGNNRPPNQTPNEPNGNNFGGDNGNNNNINGGHTEGSFNYERPPKVDKKGINNRYF